MKNAVYITISNEIFDQITILKIFYNFLVLKYDLKKIRDKNST